MYHCHLYMHGNRYKTSNFHFDWFKYRNYNVKWCINTLKNFGDDLNIYNGFITDGVLITEIRMGLTGFWYMYRKMAGKKIDN